MTGTVQHIDYTPGSGIATVVILTDDGDISSVHVEAGPFFRVLQETGPVLGRRISYEISEYGTMASLEVED